MIAVVDYGLGNVRSVLSAVERLGYEAVLTRDSDQLARAEKLILPGVGAFGDAMNRLASLGLDKVMTEMVVQGGKPVLGICLGMQLMCECSHEFGLHEGLGWIPASVRLLEAGEGLRLPHVGWNDLFQTAPNPLFEGVPQDALFYYVHSYHVHCHDPRLVLGWCEYGMTFTAVVQHSNVFGTQFHPEKSQQHGLKLLGNYLGM